MGLRYDSFNATVVAQSFAAGYFVPARESPEVTDVRDWRNLNPRLGAAYDIFDNGRTALKASIGRYVLGTSSTGNNNVALNQPILQQANSATRTWNDANGNYIPDCVLGFARDFGDPSQVFNGVDVNVRARLAQGGSLQGGLSTGRTITDTCYVVNSGQDLYHCRVTPPWSAETQVKFLLVYPLPWNFRASAVYQNLPGHEILASYVARNAEITPSLGRNMGSCRGAAVCNATATVNLIPPRTVFEILAGRLIRLGAEVGF